MRIMLLALVLCGACKQKPTLEQLTKIRDEACACPDKPCADKVNEAMEAALRGFGDTTDLDDKTQHILMDTAMCLAKQGVH
jgi:hypothetical protein